MNQTPQWLKEGWPHIWLPYTQMQSAELPLPVVGAAGCLIELADGRKILDSTAAWWSMCHGYQHPHIVAAIKAQAEKLSHVMFAGLAHEEAYRLAARLCTLTGLNRVFFSDSGSTAVEVALKMAQHYWRNKEQPRKGKFIAFNSGYHGDTFGAMSVSDRGSYHTAFDSLTQKHYHLEIPTDEYSMAEFEEMVIAIAPQVAGLIIEPLVQGAGGMKFHSADILAEIRRICREQQILFIADEIMTGFYRTGARFACDEAGIHPDILCLGKALTGGHAPLATTLVSEEIYEAFLGDEPELTFMHGPTFMAHPLGCAAANASLDIFEKHDYAEKVEAIERFFHQHLGSLSHPFIADIRIKGAIAAIETTSSVTAMQMRKAMLEKNIWMRSVGHVLYILPPLIISDAEIEQIASALKASFAISAD